MHIYRLQLHIFYICTYLLFSPLFSFLFLAIFLRRFPSSLHTYDTSHSIPSSPFYVLFLSSLPSVPIRDPSALSLNIQNGSKASFFLLLLLLLLQLLYNSVWFSPSPSSSVVVSTLFRFVLSCSSSPLSFSFVVVVSIS